MSIDIVVKPKNAGTILAHKVPNKSIIKMLTLILTLAGCLLFAIMFKFINFFEKI